MSTKIASENEINIAGCYESSTESSEQTDKTDENLKI